MTSPTHAPIVVLTDPALLEVVLSGVRRAGGVRDVPIVRKSDPETMRSILSGGAEVALAVCAPSAAAMFVRMVRQLGGRPIPVLSLRDGEDGPTVAPAALAFLADPTLVDLEIPVPSVDDDAMRRHLWDQLRQIRSEDRHHLVEVDGRPALEAPSLPAMPGQRWARRAAGAAGVLAGRIVASGRRWSAQLDA